MSAALLNVHTLVWGLTALALVANALALALPTRSVASLAVGFAAAILTLVIAALIGTFLYLAAAFVVAVLAAREWGYRWCLVSLPAVAVAYVAFFIVTTYRWPFLVLTVVAYAIPLAHQVRSRRPTTPA